MTELSVLSAVGRSTWTIDRETFALEDWGLSGQVVEDVCTVLAG